MTQQEAFQIVKKHLLCQKQRSIRGFKCLYRGPGGLKCAVGALIPDDEYNSVYEDTSLQFVHSICPTLSRLDYVFLRDMQSLHDCVEEKEWDTRLKELEIQYG